MPAVFLQGPTAAGKSALALAIAARLPCEIVSVDSGQVYRGMDIGTAKPTPAERAAVPHHLIDIRDPSQPYSAAEFVRDATRLMAEIRARGRTPLLVGGTMLYFKALIDGLVDLPQADAATRAAIDRDAAERGWPALHAELARHDPLTAARLHTTDAQRIQRALEVFRLGGRPLSELLASGGSPPPYRFVAIGLLPSERGILHQRIAERFEAMLAAGLEDEVSALRAKYRLHAALPAMRCVGYRQVWDVQHNLAPRHELRERGIHATRQLAKRQITWLNNTLRPRTVDCLAPDLDTRVLRQLDPLFA